MGFGNSFGAVGGGGGGLTEPVTLEQELTLETGQVESGVANGASAVGFDLNTANTFSTSGAKLLRVRNNGTERFGVDKDGLATITGPASGSHALNIPTGTYIGLDGSAGNFRIRYSSGSGSLQLSGGVVWFNTASAVSIPSGAIYGGLSGASGIRVIGSATDGASAYGVRIGSQTNLTNSAAKLVQVVNNDTDEKAHFHISGRLGFDNTDSSGTPGNVTINKPSGKCAVASDASSVTVTNSLVSTTSIVYAVLQDNTDALSIRSVVPASGSFTINLTGTTSGDRTVAFVVINP